MTDPSEIPEIAPEVDCIRCFHGYVNVRIKVPQTIEFHKQYEKRLSRINQSARHCRHSINQCVNKIHLQGESKKSRPPTSFIDIFASAQSFGIQFCKVIGNIYPCMFTDFRSFILTFSEMALILLRAPIIFMVSSFDCSAISVAYSANMQSASLREMMLLFSSSNV